MSVLHANPPSATSSSRATGGGTHLFINGRFLTQPTNGVQRYAQEVVLAIDRLLQDSAEDTAWTDGVELLVPGGAQARTLPLECIRTTVVGKRKGHAWEQWDLPRYCRGRGVLLCMCNAAPLQRTFSGDPTVVTIHDLSYRYFPAVYSRPYRWWYSTMTPLLMRWASRVITASQSERSAILRCYPKVASRLEVVPSGSAELPKSAEPEPTKDSIPSMLYVGSLTRRKNFHGVLSAFAEVNRRFGPVRLVVAGASGKSMTDGGFEIPQDLQHLVDFRGQIESLAALGQLYRQATCFVFPSFYEASPMPPTEAMSCGCPIVASSIPAMRERCEEAALYCDPNDASSIAEAVIRYLQDPELAAEHRRRGYEQAAKFSWTRCAQETLAVLADVVNCRRKAGV